MECRLPVVVIGLGALVLLSWAIVTAPPAVIATMPLPAAIADEPLWQTDCSAALTDAPAATRQNLLTAPAVNPVVAPAPDGQPAVGGQTPSVTGLNRTASVPTGDDGPTLGPLISR